jgi:hypothetical protein
MLGVWMQSMNARRMNAGRLNAGRLNARSMNARIMNAWSANACGMNAGGGQRRCEHAGVLVVPCADVSFAPVVTSVGLLLVRATNS